MATILPGFSSVKTQPKPIMNPFNYLFRMLFRRGTKTNTEKPPLPIVQDDHQPAANPKPEANNSSPPDDSPPGYKIRWYQ
jgi:hypothetical protein